MKYSEPSPQPCKAERLPGKQSEEQSAGKEQRDKGKRKRKRTRKRNNRSLFFPFKRLFRLGKKIGTKMEINPQTCERISKIRNGNHQISRESQNLYSLCLRVLAVNGVKMQSRSGSRRANRESKQLPQVKCRVLPPLLLTNPKQNTPTLPPNTSIKITSDFPTNTTNNTHTHTKQRRRRRYK